MSGHDKSMKEGEVKLEDKTPLESEVVIIGGSKVSPTQVARAGGDPVFTEACPLKSVREKEELEMIQHQFDMD